MHPYGAIVSKMFGLVYYLIYSFPLPVLFTIFGTVMFTTLMYFRMLVSCEQDFPKVQCRDSALARYLIKKCKKMNQPFTPVFWARNPHLQTFMSAMMVKPDFRFDREYLQMKDKGVVALDWGLPGAVKLKKHSPILIIIPGLTGDAYSVAYLCKNAVTRGYHPVVFNKRGHGESSLTTPKLQSYGDPTDFRQAVKYIRGRQFASKLTAVGLGAGCGLLMSYLGEYGSSTYLSAACCISPRYDTEDPYSKPLPQPYEFCLLMLLKKLLSKHTMALSGSIDIDEAMRCTTLSHFEEVVYSRPLGFQDMTQYWDSNSPMRDVDDVSVPFLCLNALDDPICSRYSIPYDLFKLYPNFMLVTTKRGGHCGFLEGRNLEPWADDIILDYLTAVLHFLERSDKS